VVLLHGYAETSHMWLPLIAKLADKHTVIAPDLRGFRRILRAFGRLHQGGHGAGHPRAGEESQIRPHSAGWSRYRVDGRLCLCGAIPGEVDRLVLMEAFLPGVGDWNNVFLLRDLWHFHFFGKTPLALVTGRERIYLEHFWNDFAADRKSRCRKRIANSMPRPMPSPAT